MAARSGSGRRRAAAVRVSIRASEQEVALGHRQHGRRLLGRRARRRCAPRTCRGRSRCRAARRSRGRSALLSCRVSATGTSGRRTAEPVGQPVVERRLGDPRHRQRRRATAGAAPNIGRGSMRLRRRDRGVGVAHLAQAIIPPLSTTCGRTPKNAGSHSTRSASLPTSTEPTSPSRPWVIAGQIVYLAT